MCNCLPGKRYIVADFAHIYPGPYRPCHAFFDDKPSKRVFGVYKKFWLCGSFHFMDGKSCTDFRECFMLVSVSLKQNPRSSRCRIDDDFGMGCADNLDFVIKAKFD